MDGQSVEIVAGQLVGEPEPAAVVSTRPIPELGAVLCPVCRRHTNCEVQNDLVDIPYAFYFQKGQEARQYKAVICFECYMNGIIAGAFAAHAAKQVELGTEQCGHGYPVEECCRRGESNCEETGLPLAGGVSDELPRGSANG